MEDIIPRWLESLGVLLGGVAALIVASIPFIKAIKTKRPNEPIKVNTTINLKLAKYYDGHLNRMWTALQLSSFLAFLCVALLPVADLNPHFTEFEKFFFPKFLIGTALLASLGIVWSWMNILFTQGKLINFMAGEKIAMDERKPWFSRKK